MINSWIFSALIPWLHTSPTSYTLDDFIEATGSRLLYWKTILAFPAQAPLFGESIVHSNHGKVKPANTTPSASPEAKIEIKQLVLAMLTFTVEIESTRKWKWWSRCVTCIWFVNRFQLRCRWSFDHNHSAWSTVHVILHHPVQYTHADTYANGPDILCSSLVES